MQPLIDSDIILYEIGFSSQQVEDDKIVPASWDFAEELLTKRINLICEEVGATEPPLLFLTNTPRINKLLNKDRKREEKPIVAYKDNFRNEVAKEKEYKAGRKPDKPFHFYNILSHILATYETRIHEGGLEADDYLCIEQINNAKKYGVKVKFHAGHFLLDYEDWLKYKDTTFIKDDKGYVISDTGKGPTRKVWALHRDIMGNPEGLVVDHINGDTLDNRKYNLRICTIKENVRNSASQVGTSAYKGVSWDKERDKWVAAIKVDRVGNFLGRFDSELEAAAAYDKAAKQYYGEFARLNLEAPYKKPYKETIICSRDKDVRQCPFWHYSWEVGAQASIGPIWVEPLGYLTNVNEGKVDANGKKKPLKIFGVGHKFFYYQLLTGDGVDNIGGIKGKGPAFAYNLLKDATTERECYELVAEVYVKTHGDSWKVKIKEQADLLHMVRELNEDGSSKLWMPPKM